MHTKIVAFKRASIMGLFLFCYYGVASNKEIHIESYTDIIDKAQALVLQRERTQAYGLIVSAIKRENKKSTKATQELSKFLSQISRVFISEKAQQSYELGISLRNSEPSMATQKINEALRFEPDNLLVQVESSRHSLMNGDCRSAQTNISKILEMFATDEEALILQAQSALCLGKFEDYEKIRKEWDEKKSTVFWLWLAGDIELSYKSGAFFKGESLIEQLIKLQPKFPESYYWKWKITNEVKRADLAAASKYVALCKSLNSKSAREFLGDPYLCRRTAEVESFMKKNNNPN